jgi:hypothetical protein
MVDVIHNNNLQCMGQTQTFYHVYKWKMKNVSMDE